jgi:hypothetical protein
VIILFLWTRESPRISNRSDRSWPLMPSNPVIQVRRFVQNRSRARMVREEVLESRLRQARELSSGPVASVGLTLGPFL